jgi:sugar lactone lactonase YvrE
MKKTFFLRLTLSMLSISLAAHVAQAQTGFTFTTLAGAGPSSPGSNDGTGSEARFRRPYDLTVDGSNNVYVADTENHTIRRITPAGVVTTLAGSAGLSGTNNGTGTDARFFSPAGLAIDGAGNLYVSDTDNHSIRKVTPAGVVTTLAGLSGTFGTANGTNSTARFRSPAGLAVDSATNVYVADYANHMVRKITPAGVVTTLAGRAGVPGDSDGTGTNAFFNNPAGVAVDANNNVYVADSSNFTIRKITPAGVVTTLAGASGLSGTNNGTGGDARFNFSNDAAIDGAGNIYVPDSESDTLRKITPAGVVTTVGGLAGNTGSSDGTGSNARFNYPIGVATDAAGNLYVADTFNNLIRVGSPPSGGPLAIVSSGPGFGFQGGQFRFDLTGSVGQKVVVDVSTNLTTWSPVWTNTFASGTVSFAEPQTTGIRYYRAYTP